MKADVKFKLLALAIGILLPLLFVGLFPTGDLRLYDEVTAARQSFFEIFRENLARPEARHRSIAMLGERETGDLSQSTQARLAGKKWDIEHDMASARALVEAGAAAVVVDRPLSLVDAQQLAKASSGLERVFLPVVGNNYEPAERQPQIVPWKIVLDADQQLRRVYLAINDSQGKPHPTVPLILYADFLRCPLSEIRFLPNHILVGDKEVPVAADGFGLTYLPDLYPAKRHTQGNTREAESLDKDHVLDSLIPGTLQELVGESSAAYMRLAPNHYFFLGNYLYVAEGEYLTYRGKYRDFQLQAITLDSLIREYHLHWLTGWRVQAAFLLWNLILVGWVFAQRSGFSLILNAGIQGGTILAVSTMLSVCGYYLPPARFLVAIILYASLAGLKLWLSTVSLLYRFGGRAAAMAAQFGINSAFTEIDDRTASILFINLPDILKIMERENSPDLLRRRKEFSAMVTNVCSRHQGIVHDYQGDALMIGFGTDVQHRDPDHAIKAIQAARQLHTEFAALAALWLEALDPEHLHLYVGICTGEVAVGFVGASHYKKAPAAIGDTTNVAARLMGSAKKQHVEILISKPTHDACPDRIVAESLPPVQLKGKTHLVEIFRVVEITRPV